MRKIDVIDSPEKEILRDTQNKIVKSNHKEIQPYLNYLSEHFGVEREEFR